MTSKAEQICQAATAALTTPAMASTTAVFRDLTTAVEANHTLAVVLDCGDETAPVGSTGWVQRVLDLHLVILARGASPLTVADPALVEAHARLMADATLGGLVLDLQEGDTARQTDRLEKPVAEIRKTYRVSYRTLADSLE